MSSSDKRFRITPTQQMISSCTGALITSLLVTPLDVIKIRLQSQQKTLLSSKCFLYCNGLMDHICQCANGGDWVKRGVGGGGGHFTSTLDAFTKIIKTEGPLSLWSGLPPTLIMAVPSTIVYFVSYEQLRLFLNDNHTHLTGVDDQPVCIPLLAGGVARFWSVGLVSPLELIRTKMQSKGGLSYGELRNACASLYEARGIRGFWLGFGPTVSRDVPFSAIYWGCYEGLKKLFKKEKDPSLTFSFLAGAASGSVAGTLTLPFDVVKTHKQIELGEVDFKVRGGKTLTSTKDILTRIYRQNGVTGWFTGLVPRVVKVAPACAIMISTYEYGKRWFEGVNRRRWEERKGEE